LRALTPAPPRTPDGADLTHADLARATARRASFKAAKLDDANLFQVDLAGAELAGASFHNALLSSTSFGRDENGKWAQLDGGALQMLPQPLVVSPGIDCRASQHTSRERY
jgi:hypothetical protein